MSTLSEEKVLRINCPGFGTTSTLPLGEAKPLAMYDVIIVNPVSVAHLFESNSHTLQTIEELQRDGISTLRLDDETFLDATLAELDLRKQELTQFIRKGGLLIYFLTPPFTVQASASSMDNYSWLGEWAPDRPQGDTRNMSATIRGKAVDVTADGGNSIFAPYLKQSDIEWSTIIRIENLTEGYVPLATAGPNKCIAACKLTGHHRGMVVFLPAPYSQQRDEVLKECISRWHAQAEESKQDAAPEPAGFNSGGSLDGLLAADVAPSPAARPPERQEVAEEPQPLSTRNDETKGGAETGEAPQPVSSAAAAAEPADGDSIEGNGHPQAADLIKKMEQEISKPQVPQWCQEFSFAELDQLRQDLSDLEEQIRLAQAQMEDVQERIQVMDDLKNALLSAQAEHLKSAVTRVFEHLGWKVKPAFGNEDELWLLDGDVTQAIVRLVWTASQPNRSELAHLAESVITYWGAHEVEPKGIFLASTWADRPPAERNDEDYSYSMVEFAERKNLSLLTTSQLLSIYRDLTVNGSDPAAIREQILTTSGCVPGFKLETPSRVKSKAAT